MKLLKNLSDLKEVVVRGTAPKYPLVQSVVIGNAQGNISLEAIASHSPITQRSFHVERGYKVESLIPRGTYGPSNLSNASFGTSSPAPSYDPSIFTHHNASTFTVLTAPSPTLAPDVGLDFEAGKTLFDGPDSKQNCEGSHTNSGCDGCGSELDLDKVYADFLAMAGEMLPQTMAFKLNNIETSETPIVDKGSSEGIADEELQDPNFGLFRFNPEYDLDDDSEFEFAEHLAEVVHVNEVKYFAPPVKAGHLLEFHGIKEVRETRMAQHWDNVDGPTTSPLGFSVVIPSSNFRAYGTSTKSFMFGVGISHFKSLANYLAEKSGRPYAEDMVLASKVYPSVVHDQRSFDLWMKWNSGRGAKDRVLWVLH